MSGGCATDGFGRGLAAALAAAGYAPPILVVADPQTVGRLALAWLESFDEEGWLYRVRSLSIAAGQAEMAAIVREARSLGAKTIAAIGDAALVAAVSRAADQANIPCAGTSPR